METLKVIGLNSGTSMDGIDAAIFEIGPAAQIKESNGLPQLKIKMLGSLLYPFTPDLKSNLQRLITGESVNLDELTRINVAIGCIFADAALTLIKDSGLTPSDIGLIGSHGQTIWHAPSLKKMFGQPTMGSLQIGEPAVIAQKTGIPVIADFRVADLAAGGQGAPLVAFADQILFGQDRKPTGVLNIGGIANLTVLDSSGKAIMAFDTGPGNMLMDEICKQFFKCEFDADGKLAQSGTVISHLLNDWLKHPYFSKTPPKTTGREMFGRQYAEELIMSAMKESCQPESLLATATALSASSIGAAYLHFVKPTISIERMVLGGGGADNKTLVSMLGEHLGPSVPLVRHEELGYSTKFKEALLFALLAYTSHFRIPNNVPVCTGASQAVCLGKLCSPA